MKRRQADYVHGVVHDCSELKQSFNRLGLRGHDGSVEGASSQIIAKINHRSQTNQLLYDLLVAAAGCVEEDRAALVVTGSER